MAKRNLTKDFLLVVIVVIVGKVMGFARESVVAYLYGASLVTDAFYYVNGLIGSMIAIITMGLGQAFTPIFLDTQLKYGRESSSSFANKIVTLLVSLGIIISLLMILFPGCWLDFLAPGLNSDTRLLAEKMLKIMSLNIPIYICFAIRKCILNANNKYIITEASGIPYSFSIVIFSFLLFNIADTFALPFAAVLGVVLQLIFTYCFSFKDYRYNIPDLQKNNETVKQYFLLLVPLAMVAVLEESNGLLRKSLAGGMGEGAIANLSYCMTLTTLINGIIIASISTVYFPHFIRNFSESNIEEFKSNLKRCLAMASALVFPLVVYLFIFANQVVEVVYERGSFTHEDTLVVGSLFSVYVLGTAIYSYRYIIRTAFFSTKNVKTPMFNELFYLVICIICNVFQVKVLQSGLVALGIAWVLAIAVMTPILFIQFKKQYFQIFDRYFILETFKTIISSIILAVFLLLFKTHISNFELILQLAIALITTVLLYITLMMILKSQTVKEVMFLLKLK